jgi:YD repeat-containing protein
MFNFYVVWKEYDEHGNCIYCKDSRGFEEWYEYDEYGNVIRWKNNG